MSWCRSLRSLMILAFVLSCSYGKDRSGELERNQELVQARYGIPPLKAETQVRRFSSRTDRFEEARATDLRPGDAFEAHGYLFEVDAQGTVVVYRDITWQQLDKAHQPYDHERWRFPKASDVVYVVAPEPGNRQHEYLGSVSAGEELLFQGKFVSVHATDGGKDVVETGEVLVPVVRTFVLPDRPVWALAVEAHGVTQVIEATPDHPFYVPSRNRYERLDTLEPGWELQLEGAPLRVASVANTGRRETTYNLETAEVHNFFIHAPGTEGFSVLVHNTNGCDVLRKGEGGKRFEASRAKRLDGKPTCEHCGLRTGTQLDHIDPVKQYADLVGDRALTVREARLMVNDHLNTAAACGGKGGCNPKKGARTVSAVSEPGTYTPPNPNGHIKSVMDPESNQVRQLLMSDTPGIGE